MTFIDVGANKGDFTLFTGHLIGESGKVIAVEPAPENIHWLNKSLAENELENITLVDAALSDENGHATFRLGDRSGWGNLLPDRDELEDGTIEVRTVTLDSLVPELELDRVDAVKIDVEGGEVAVVRGAEETIDRFRPMIWLEIHADVDVDWLHEFSPSVTTVLSSFQLNRKFPSSTHPTGCCFLHVDRLRKPGCQSSPQPPCSTLIWQTALVQAAAGRRSTIDSLVVEKFQLIQSLQYYDWDGEHRWFEPSHSHYLLPKPGLSFIYQHPGSGFT